MFSMKERYHIAIDSKIAKKTLEKFAILLEIHEYYWKFMKKVTFLKSQLNICQTFFLSFCR